MAEFKAEMLKVITKSKKGNFVKYGFFNVT